MIIVSEHGAPTQQVQPNHALVGRAGLWDGRPRELLRQGWVGRVGHPLDLPEGYHTPARGQSRTVHVPVASRVAPGLASGRAVEWMPHHPQRASDHR